MRLRRLQHLGHVAAHDAPVGVDLVDHHELEAGKEAGPGGVKRQQPHMQHVRVADQHVGRLGLDRLALARRGVAVVNRGPQERGGQGGVQFLQGLELVLLQGLQGEEIKGVAAVVPEQRFQHRQIIDQGLAAGRRRGHQQVLAGPDVPQGLGLMAIEPGNPQALQGRAQGHRQPEIVRAIGRHLLGQIAVMTDNIPMVSGGFELVDEVF